MTLMASHGIVMTSSSRFRRAHGTALRIFRRDECENRITRLGQSLGVSLADRPIIMRWTAARELLRYPPASVGRASLPKMADEYSIFREISATLERNDLDSQTLIKNQDCERLFRFVERRPPSILRKWEQTSILEALPFYLAVRLRESIDAILLCFTRKARCLRSRISEEVEEDRRDESLALLERSGRHLRALQYAISEALALGAPSPLLPFQRKLSRLYRDGAATLDRNRLYRLIGSRGTYTRKLAHRLGGIHFEGHDPNSKALVGIIHEVLRFAPFEERIPKPIIGQLPFLQVPKELLAQRRVFEPVVMITLADYLWSGRATATLSRRFSNVWADIPAFDGKVDPSSWISLRRRRLDAAWKAFENDANIHDLIKDGRLHIKRPPRHQTIRIEMNSRKRHEALISEFRIIPILEVVLKVHRSTGFLDKVKLKKNSPHQLSDEERLRLASGVLIGLGMNIGIGDMASVVHKESSVGRIQSFMDNYMTKENLEQALGRLIHVWNERKMGKQWGSRRAISVDGRVVGAFQNNLLSRYHYRKGRSGMTVYWFRRDDGIATRVRPLGNQEWEAWHVLDELLHPLADQELKTSCGDTQGQFLGLWALAGILGKEILTRFRRPSRVLLFKPSSRNRTDLKNLRVVQWDKIERSLPSILRLAEAIKVGKLKASDVLRRWHLYDENGCDVAEAIRELGKVDRTEFLLKYARDIGLQCYIRDSCNKEEAWNSFHEAICWGNGGKLRSNDPVRQEEILLALTLLMNSIVFYNVEKYGEKLKKARAPTPVIWDHIQVLGKYQFRRSWIKGGSPSEN